MKKLLIAILFVIVIMNTLTIYELKRTVTIHTKCISVTTENVEGLLILYKNLIEKIK